MPAYAFRAGQWYAKYQPSKRRAPSPQTSGANVMTAAVLNAVSSSSLSGVFARFYREFEAFFEEQGRALHRAHREYPFGL
jgi:hypothetical protein